MCNMDKAAINLVSQYVESDLEGKIPFSVFIVWKCKTIQNWKYLCATTLEDGLYFELTYNGDKNEWYIDVYRQVDKQTVPGDNTNE